MSDQITVARNQQYKANVELLLQQRGSKLRRAVMEQSLQGKASKAIEQIGAVAAVRRSTRHADTPIVYSPHSARWVFPTDYEWADLIDDQDKLQMLIDPQSPYAQNGAYALGRAIDDEIISAALGTAYTGENGTGTELWTGQTIAVGTTGMTVSKLRQAKRMLMAAEVDVDNDPLFCAITARQVENLLQETLLTSIDYNTVRPLVEGGVAKFMGFTFIHCERLPLNGSSDRQCIAWARSGLCLGVWNDITTRIEERADKSFTTQVYVKGTFGATRTQLQKVVEIVCDEP